MPLHRFIQAMDPYQYGEYQRERISNGLWKRRPEPTRPRVQSQVKTPQRLTNPLDLLSRVDRVKEGHKAMVFCESRKIPDLTRVYHCPRFYLWTNHVLKSKKFSEKALRFDHPRLIIPFLDEEGRLVAFQGRDYRANSENKYVTIKVDESSPKVFGLDRLGDGDVYALEGPIDSMFVPNSVAFAGGSHESLSRINVDKERIIVCYDNEPRKSETIKKMERAIADGYRVCIWPSYVTEKDPNDMVLASLDPKTIIDQRTFKGLAAELELKLWKK